MLYSGFGGWSGNSSCICDDVKMVISQYHYFMVAGRLDDDMASLFHCEAMDQGGDIRQVYHSTSGRKGSH